MKAVIIKKEDYDALPFLICDAIWELSHRRYGFTMVSRETKQEIDKDTLVGALSPTLKKTLDAARRRREIMKLKYISEPNNAGIIDDPIREISDEQRAHAIEWYKNHKSYFEVTK